ncbi:MAG: hypothetical protein Kow0042_18910 [Calditrichia bacterium]
MIIIHLIKIVVAFLCALLIAHRLIGFKQSIRFPLVVLICLGSTLFMLFAMDIDPGTFLSPFRMGAYIMLASGFIGAGFVVREKSLDSGVLWAAVVWISAGIGMGIGAGYFLEGITATLLIYLVMSWVWHEP